MNIKDKILERLINNKGMRVSGEQLASELWFQELQYGNISRY